MTEDIMKAIQVRIYINLRAHLRYGVSVCCSTPFTTRFSVFSNSKEPTASLLFFGEILLLILIFITYHQRILPKWIIRD